MEKMTIIKGFLGIERSAIFENLITQNPETNHYHRKKMFKKAQYSH